MVENGASYCSDMKKEDNFASASEQFHIPAKTYNSFPLNDSIKNFKKSKVKKHVFEDGNYESKNFCCCSDDSSSESSWMYNPVFSRYWKTYDICRDWFRLHQRTSEEMFPNFSKTFDFRHFEDKTKKTNDYCCSPLKQTNPYLKYMSYSNNLCNHGDSFICSGDGDSSSRNKSPAARNTTKNRKRKKKKNKRNAKKRKSSASQSDMKPESEIEMQFAPEFMQFLMESAKHRKERDEQMTQNPTESSYAGALLNKESISMKKRTTEAPKQQPGSQRLEEIKLLYGKDAQMIHGMETAMQLNFEQNCDIKQPQFWPNLPLQFQ